MSSPSRKSAVPELCPCGSGCPYNDCCGQYISGCAVAPTAEALMRSRYTAYAQGDEAYLRRTWHPSTYPGNLDLTSQGHVQWIELNVVNKEGGGEGEDKGTVEFIAKFKVNGRAQRLHEKSRFLKEAGQWYYIDGAFR